MSKNKVMLAIASLENDDALMRLDKVSAAVAMLKEAHLEAPKEVETGAVPTISTEGVDPDPTPTVRQELRRIASEFRREIEALAEKYPALKELVGE